MKSNLYKLFLLTLFITSISISSCKKDNNNGSDKTEEAAKPEAMAAFDNKSGGVYKGTVAGSSGFFKIVLQNGSTRAEITFDGVTKTLTPNLGGWTSGQALKNADFASGDWHLIFSVDADGGNPSVTINIPGHITVAVVVKETSSNRVDVFEGTYSGIGTKGTFNLTSTGNKFTAIYKGAFAMGDSTLSASGNISGARNGNTITGENGAINGTINGDAMTGTYHLIEKQLYVREDNTIGERILVDVNIAFSAKRQANL